MFTDIDSDKLAAYANPVSTYIAYTLVDITDTGIISPKKNRCGFHQAQNLNTFIQILSFRTQILEYKVECLVGNSHDYGLVDFDNNSVNIWKLTFVPESTDPWLKNENRLHWLANDCMGVPIHTGLTESIKIFPEIISTVPSAGSKINTCFNIVENT